jgi:hypothetical protein
LSRNQSKPEDRLFDIGEDKASSNPTSVVDHPIKVSPPAKRTRGMRMRTRAQKLLTSLLLYFSGEVQKGKLLRKKTSLFVESRV